MKELQRIHVVLPRDLVEAIDRIAGRRKRSQFIVEAVREKLTRERQTDALAVTRGALAGSYHPEWEMPEKTSQWVHDLRRAEDEHRARKLRASS